MLPKSNRLSSHQIPHVMRSGTRYQSEFLTCIMLSLDRATPSRFGVIISAKAHKRSTARNRMKRLVREAVQDLLPTIASGTQGLFIARGRLPGTEHNVRNVVQELLQRAHVLQNTTGELR